MCVFSLMELDLLKEELMCSINNVLQRGFIGDERFVHMDFEKVRFKRLVRLYEKIDTVMIDKLDDIDNLRYASSESN